MTNFTYSRTFALTASGTSTALAKSATGKCYDVGDTTRTTPLSLTLVVGGAVVTQVSSDSNGQLPDFTTATRTSVVWKDNATGLESVLTTTDVIPGPPGPAGATGATGAKGDPGDIQTWQPTTFYPLNQIIVNPSAQLVTVTTAHTSTSTYDPTKFSPSGAEPVIAAGTTAQYWRGDKTFQTLNKAAAGLGNVDNTSDVNKPVSTAQQTALNLKANLASPTFTGTVGGITAAMVGLGNVNNTSDVNKPISTAQQAALDGKYDETLAFLPTTTHDLNTYTTAGNYHQNANSGASSGTNYPIAQAGLLQVFQTPGTGTAFTYQFYTAYEGANRQFWRTQYGGTWGAWKEVADTGSYVPNTAKGTANGVASLDGTTHVPIAQIPDLSSLYGGTDVPGFLFFTFGGDGTVWEKMNVHYSPDGKSVVATPFNPVLTLTAPNSLRDPSAKFINGYWFAVHTIDTAGSTTAGGKSATSFGVRRSADLINWTDVGNVSVAAATSIDQCWAPELVVDNNGDVYVFFTNLTAASAGSLWRVKATNTALTTWSAPTAMAWTAAPSFAIDACYIYNGTKWYCFYSNHGTIERGNATTLTGTWTIDKTGDWAGWGLTQNEGPSIVQDGSVYRIYFDKYVAGTGMSWSESTDLNTWTTLASVLTPGMAGNQKLRHGSVVKLATKQQQAAALGILGDQNPLATHTEFTAVYSLPTGAVTAAAGTVTQSGVDNSTYPGIITSNGSGLFTFNQRGVYDIFLHTTTSPSPASLTRSFTEMTDGGSVSYGRISGGAEDKFSAPFMCFLAEAGQQVKFSTFQNGSASTTATTRLKFTLKDKA